MVVVSDNGVAFAHSTVLIAKKARRVRKERCIVTSGNWTRRMVYKRNLKHMAREARMISVGERATEKKSRGRTSIRSIYEQIRAGNGLWPGTVSDEQSQPACFYRA